MSWDLKRYVLRPTKEQGFEWAHIVLGSDGYFSAVSDYGNYAYLWNHHGCVDFREFLADPKVDVHYFGKKLAPNSDRFSEERTVRYVRERIIDLRKQKLIGRETARTEWEIIDEHLRSNGQVLGLHDWMEDTELGKWLEIYDISQSEPDPEVVAFCSRILPRLAELLRAELAAERQPLQQEGVAP